MRICNTGNGGALNNNNAINANGAAPIGRKARFEYRRGKAGHLSQGVAFLHPKGANKKPETKAAVKHRPVLLSAPVKRWKNTILSGR